MTDLSQQQQNYENRMSSQTAAEKALQRATARLKADGITYPLYNYEKSATENLDALNAYSALEMKYYHLFLKEPSGPRPLIIDSVVKVNKQQFAKPYKEWVE